MRKKNFCDLFHRTKDSIRKSDSAEWLTVEGHDVGILKITPGERWLDSIIGNVNRYVLEAGEKGVLVLYDEALWQSPLTIRMKIISDAEQTFRIYCSGETRTLSLTPGKNGMRCGVNVRNTPSFSGGSKASAQGIGTDE